MYELERDICQRVTDLRVAGGEDVFAHARVRPRRDVLAPDGKLVILAADHPARGVTAIGEDPLGMCNRADYLGRIVRVLRSGFVDGLMGTPDIIEETLAVDLLRCQAGEDSFLAGKLLIGSMNRGGLAGTVFEMDDRFTAFTARRMAELHMDGAKMMVRIEPLEWASGRTLEACARAVDQCLDEGLTVFLEPLIVHFQEGKYVLDTSTEVLARVCGIASALGKSSWKTWLKLPFSVDYSLIAKSTLCPILLLGGPAAGDFAGLLQDFSRGLQAGDNVRGALVGRQVLYPGEVDPAAAARAVWRLVHDGASLPQVIDDLR